MSKPLPPPLIDLTDRVVHIIVPNEGDDGVSRLAVPFDELFACLEGGAEGSRASRLRPPGGPESIPHSPARTVTAPPPPPR